LRYIFTRPLGSVYKLEIVFILGGIVLSNNSIELGSKGIKRALKNYNMFDSFVEFIWNGFDAEATCVEVMFSKNGLDGIDSVIIKDNGYGITKETLKYKFKPVFQSNKAVERISNRNHSTYHGKNGVGRLTFFNFADNAIWDTVYKNNEQNYKYSIKIDSEFLDEFTDSETQETNEVTGTKVTFDNVDAEFEYIEIISYIKYEFAWYLELKKDKDYKIIVDGKPLDYSNIMEYKDTQKFVFEKSSMEFDVTLCQWSNKLNDEYSKYYYVNSKGEEKFKENTTLNNKGDKFYHSVYIKSELFDNFKFEVPDDQVVLDEYTQNSEEFRFISTQVDRLLHDKRNPYIKQYTKKYIDKLKKSGAYPHYDSNNLLDHYKEKSLDNMISAIYCAEPKIFNSLNGIQQKTLIRWHFRYAD